MTLYKGFSTKQFLNQDPNTIVGLGENFFGPYSVTDKNLIITDLLNHFHIRKGEKLMNPDFGCLVWDKLFDPLTTTLKNEIVNNVSEIIAQDPRISLIDSITVTESPKGQGLYLSIQIVLKSTNELVSLNLGFDGTTGQLNSTVSY
jgi:phage baseplate assembly protein W